jgi:hypothetical protein
VVLRWLLGVVILDPVCYMTCGPTYSSTFHAKHVYSIQMATKNTPMVKHAILACDSRHSAPVPKSRDHTARWAPNPDQNHVRCTLTDATLGTTGRSAI